MKAAIQAQVRRAVAAAATLTGKRFGLLVASSVVATSAIVASAMTGTGGSGALAALIGQSLASDNTPVASAPPAAPEAEESAPEAKPGKQLPSRRKPPTRRNRLPKPHRNRLPRRRQRNPPQRRRKPNPKRARSNTSSSSP